MDNKTELNKLMRAMAFLFIWGVLFSIIHLVHIKLFIVDVIFYEALKDLILSAIIVFVLYAMFFRKSFKFSNTNLCLLAISGLSCGYIFAITVPTVIDRSLSAYFLEKIVQRGGGVQQSAMDDIFIQEYIPEYKLVEIRLQEALSSGTIIIENGCVQVTPKGRKVASLTSFYRKNLLPKKRLLLGRVTDDLTDPFRESKDIVDYNCGVENN